MAEISTWSGQWVAQRLGVRLRGDRALPDLLGLALRRNPKRAHLLVSNVLGKHVPCPPRTVHAVGVTLGERVRALLGDGLASQAVVLGYAETATALGHSVADGLALAPYLHSTRRAVPGVRSVGGFEEEHSHATSHLLLPEDPELLAGSGPLILVDDEFSTGRTVLNTVRALHRRYPRDRYIIVALVDMRGESDRRSLEAFAAKLGAQVEVVTLATGTVELPGDVLRRGRELVAAHESADHHGTVHHLRHGPAERRGTMTRVALRWPAGVPDGGRHGFTPAQRILLEAALPGMGVELAAAVSPDARRILVLGCEELMYAPLRLAEALQTALDTARPSQQRAEVHYSTTTRSPVLPVDHPGYAIRTRICFPAHDGTAGQPRGATPATPHPPLDPGSVSTPAEAAFAVVAAGGSSGTSTTGAPPSPAAPPPGGESLRFAYNVAAGSDPSRRFDTVLAVVDSAADTDALHTPGGLLDILGGTTDQVLLAVVPSHVPTLGPRAARPLDTPRTAGRSGGPTVAGSIAATAGTRQPAPPRPPRTPLPPPSVHKSRSGALPEPLHGPAFSSYAPDEVAWLLKDLSEVTLEAPTEEREEAIQSGGAHYAETLPVEYQPSEEYQALFKAALAASASRIARAVGVVTDTVLAERGPTPVLASLARAGTPVGVLMRRWAQHIRDVDLPHYAVSIVRGRGMDPVALRYLASHHDPADVVFVDGWTGKGAITRELAATLRDFPGFDPRIAVLADPGATVDTFGTRDDFLIPSACLNSTVSGLISRTVLRADLIGPDDFHGAKFYQDLAQVDVTGFFLDSVTARFPDVLEQVHADREAMASIDRAPTWAGWAAVERISASYGIGDVNLVKPGVGETTRVLLRRVPWRVLASRDAGADLDHVRLLAAQRGVPIEEVEDLPYSCVGLIHPRYTRGAVGPSGTAADVGGSR